MQNLVSTDTAIPHIKMLKHFFTHVYVQANADAVKYLQKKEKKPGFDIIRKINSLKNNENNSYQISLLVEIVKKEGYVLTHRVQMQAIGFVKVSDSVDEKNSEGVAIVYGASLLYGAIREHLYILTSPGPFPPIYLPTATFVPATPDDGQQSNTLDDNAQTINEHEEKQ
jgi:preprotein translocase subunit SecB